MYCYNVCYSSNHIQTSSTDIIQLVVLAVVAPPRPLIGWLIILLYTAGASRQHAVRCLFHRHATSTGASSTATASQPAGTCLSVVVAGPWAVRGQAGGAGERRGPRRGAAGARRQGAMAAAATSRRGCVQTTSAARRTTRHRRDARRLDHRHC